MIYCNIKIETLSKHFTQLFSRDECYLSQTKLENLLAIAKITLLQHDIVLFDEEIIKKKSGFGIDYHFPLEYRGNIVIGNFYLLILDFCPISPSAKPSNFDFYNDEKINEIINDVLYKIYFNFCNTATIDIAKQIDEFKDEINWEENIEGNAVFSFVNNYNPPENP